MGIWLVMYHISIYNIASLGTQSFTDYINYLYDTWETAEHFEDDLHGREA